MRLLSAALLILLTPACLGTFLLRAQQMSPGISNRGDLTGTWKVEFNLSGVGKKILIVKARSNGFASALLQDGGASDFPAEWSLNINQRASFSTEVELQIGTCCREVGTLVLKGNFESNGSLAGRAVFLTATDDEENFVGLRTLTGSFTATRISN